MGERGPIPDSARVVRMQRPGGQVKEQVRAGPGRPPRPRWLPPKARTQWDRVCDALEPTGILSEADGPALAVALCHWVLAREACEVLLGEGVTVEDRSRGRTSKHPAHQVMRDHSAAFQEWCKQFGLTPAARARLSPVELSDREDHGFDT